ncbi:ATP-binding protein [Streptomyces sp. NPDC051940]|uniref:sensor histidine kinase n=1 Tax=Streptomyces sp. NPDC051940 TaxID=3155675 RepID=UPI003438D39A
MYVDDAWLRANYPAARVVTVTSRFAVGVPVVVLGVLLLARPGRALRRLGGVLVAAGVCWFLPTVVGDLLAAGRPTSVDALAAVTASVAGFASRAPTLLLLPLWLAAAPRTAAGRRARTLLTALTCAYFLGYGVLWALVYPEVQGVPNPLLGTPPSRWAVAHSGAYESVEQHVTVAVAAAGTAALLLTAVRVPGRERRVRLLLAVLHPLCVLLLLTEVWGPGLRTVTALLTGTVLWVAAVGAGVAGTGTWRLDLSARHRVAQACVFMVLAAVVTACAATTWLLLPAVRGTALLAAVGALGLGLLLPQAARRGTRWVESLFYGPRARPHDAVRALAARIQQAPHPRELPAQICRSAVEDIGVPGASVSVDTRSGPRLLAAAGLPPGDAPAQTFPLRYQGQVVGRLDVVRDGSGTPPERDSDLLGLLAGQAGPALATLRLTEEAQAARERLALTREEERRRLRREIHDGLGPLLASVRLRIDTAQAGCAGECAGGGQLRAAVDGLGEALVEVRRITAGLAPAALVERGLADAVGDLARRLGHPGLLVTVTADALPAVTPGVETAAYRIAAEALTNAVRHSGARHIHITLTADEDSVTVTVTDDGGPAAPPTASGTGLASMTERAEEIGGACSVTTTAAGTVVHARLPQGPPSAPVGDQPPTIPQPL